MRRTTRFGLCRHASRRRRALAAAVPTIGLVAAVCAPPALAESSSTPIASWGTAKAGSRAQTVRAIVEADGIAYFGRLHLDGGARR
jgi:hypothetical protein